MTGLSLNHPDWFASETPPIDESSFALAPEQLEEVRGSLAPAEVLTRIAAERVTLYGQFKDGTVAGDEVFLPLQGVRGSSDIRANLVDGSDVVASEQATTDRSDECVASRRDRGSGVAVIHRRRCRRDDRRRRRWVRDFPEHEWQAANRIAHQRSEHRGGPRALPRIRQIARTIERTSGESLRSLH